MKTFKSYTLILFFLCFLLGCAQDISFMNEGTSYYILEEGDEKVYKIEEEIYSPSIVLPEVKSYYEKHVVTTVKVQEHVQVATVLVYTSSESLGKWIEKEMYVVEKRPEGFIETKMSDPKLVLRLPIKNNTSWNENSYNNQEKVTINYSNVDQPFSFEDQLWTNTIKVIEVKEKSTLIDYLNKYKVYAPNLGLVYAEDIALEYCQDSNCIGQYKIVSGRKYTKILVD